MSPEWSWLLTLRREVVDENVCDGLHTNHWGVSSRVLGREGSRRLLSDDNGVVFPRVPSDAGYPMGTGVQSPDTAISVF